MGQPWALGPWRHLLCQFHSYSEWGVWCGVTALGGIAALCFLTSFLWPGVLSTGHSKTFTTSLGSVDSCVTKGITFLNLGEWAAYVSLCSDLSFWYMLGLVFLCTPFSHASLGLRLWWLWLTFLKPDKGRFSLDTLPPPPKWAFWKEGWCRRNVSPFLEPRMSAFLCF